MTKRWLIILLLFLLPVPVAAQVKVKGDTTYAPFKKIALKATDVSSKSAQFLWDVDGDADTVEAGDTLYVWAPPGTYQVRLTAVDFDAKKVERARFSFSVAVPAPPTPPTPPAPPKPPGPQPVAGLKVLIVYDSSAEAAMPKAQQMILRTTPIRDWLNSNCAASTETMSKKAWFIVDRSADMSSTAFAAWMNRPRAGVPWIVLGSDSGVAYEGPLPADTAATIALLTKYTQQYQYRKAA